MTRIQVFEIDNDIPMPQTGPQKVPLSKLEVGESILFPTAMRTTVASAAWRLKRDENKQFAIKKMDDTNCRVWRVE